MCVGECIQAVPGSLGRGGTNETAGESVHQQPQAFAQSFCLDSTRNDAIYAVMRLHRI